MTAKGDSLYDLIDLLRKRGPECIDILSAKTEDEFEEAFIPILEKAVAHLEKNSKNYQKLDETGLSAVLAAAIAFPGLTVVQEAHSNGHVDLTIELDHSVPMIRKLGEAKIHKGPGYHIEGIAQLLGRYTTGREGSGLLISYFRNKDIKGLTANLRAAMDDKRPFNQLEPCKDHKLKWTLSTKHKHSSGEVVLLTHLG